MAEQKILFIPEKTDAPNFFAKNGVYQGDTVVTFTNVRLWVIVDSLDKYSAESTVFATRSDGSESYLYEISFQGSEVPGTYKNENHDDSGRHFFYVPPERFLQFEASKLCIPVPDNRWAPHCLHFHTIAALYNLSIVPSLTFSVFSRPDIYEKSLFSFYQSYYDPSLHLYLKSNDLNQPLLPSPPKQIPESEFDKTGFESNAQLLLSLVFTRLYFDLDILGFTDPSSLEEKQSYNAATILVKKLKESHFRINDSQPFSFGDLAYAVRNFKKVCFPDHDDSGKITPEIWNTLQQTVSFVSSTLRRKSYLDSQNEEDLREAVVVFQKAIDIPQGVCDPFTLRYLWAASLEDGCELATVCRYCNLDLSESMNFCSNQNDQGQNVEKKQDFIGFGEEITFSKTIEPVKIDNPTPEFEAIEGALNTVLTQVKTREEGIQWLTNGAEAAIRSASERIEVAAEDANSLEQNVQEVKEKLDKSTSKVEDAIEIFNETASIMDKIIEEHNQMQKEYIELQNRYQQQRIGNQFLLFILIFVSVIFVLVWIKRK